MVYWRDKDDVEYLIVLPEIVFSRAEEEGRAKADPDSAMDHAS